MYLIFNAWVVFAIAVVVIVVVAVRVIVFIVVEFILGFFFSFIPLPNVLISQHAKLYKETTPSSIYHTTACSSG